MHKQRAKMKIILFVVSISLCQAWNLLQVVGPLANYFLFVVTAFYYMYTGGCAVLKDNKISLHLNKSTIHYEADSQWNTAIKELVSCLIFPILIHLRNDF